MAQVSYGTITITDTNDIERIYMEYAQSDSNSIAPTSASDWSEDIPAWEQGKYIWQRTVVKKEGVALSSDSYGDPVCLTGSTGSTGATGRGVSSIVTTYCNYGTGTPAASYSGWSTTVPTYDSTKPNYWIKTVITYTSGTPTTDTKIYQDNGITSATATAASAKTQAAAAEGKADSAVSTANTANGNASNALNIANGTSQHFWWITDDIATTGGTIAAGAYITDIAQSTFKTNPSNYGNLLLRSDGVYLNVGLQTLASFKSNALTFYNSAGTELGKFGSTGLEMSGTLNIKGGGRIGQDSDNYWEFGDNKSYNDEDSAYLIGKGTASIQLGETGHWRLDKNRIHTGWYQLSDSSSSAPAGSLHFDTGADGDATFYWDYGMHYPNKAGNGNNKFLYIRRSNDTTSTTLATMKGRIDDDSWWTYKFYIDGNGNLTTTGSIDAHSISIDGVSIAGGSLVAGSLSSYAGSITQPVYFPSSGDNKGKPVAIGYTIQTSVPAGALFTDTWKPLTTSQAGYVPVKAPNSTSQFLRGDATWAAVTKSNVGLGNVENVALSTWAGSSSLTTTKVGTLAEAATRGVDTSISATTISTNLPTSAAVAAFVEGKGYITTDNNTTYSLTQDSSNGHKITLTPSSGTAQTITIPDNNTTYTFANGINGFTVTPSGGTTQTVTVTPSIANNVTGSGTSGYLAKFTGANTIGNGPALSSTGIRYLKEDGTWGTPEGIYSLPTASSSTLGGIKVGSGLSISEEVLSHSDTSSQASSSNSGRTYIQSITLDTYGHVTGLSTATETVTNTHNTAYLYAGKSDGTANAATTNGNTYLILMDGGSATTRRKISGSGTVSVVSDASGNITVTGSAHPTALNGVSFNDGVLTFTKTDGNSTTIQTDNFVITQATGATALVGTDTEHTPLSVNGPVKFTNGVPVTMRPTTSTGLFLKDDGTWATPTAAGSADKATNDSDGNPINTTYIKKSIGTAAGDIIYWSASGTPVRLKAGNNGQVLKLVNGIPSWATDNNTTYSLSGALSSHTFTTTLTPSSGSATTSAFTLAAGDNITLTDSGTTITIKATNTNTATAVDNILDGSNNGTAITYAPYTARADKLMFYTGTTAPNGTTRLNLNGYLYATKLYSNNKEVLTEHQSLDNYKTKQTAITAPTAVTNKWVNTLAQNANGEITVTYTTLDTSGTWSGNAVTATSATTATTAGAFSSAASVTLTGDTTGSASSTKGWSITTKTDRISTVADNRTVATTPNDYSNKIIFQGLKNNSAIGAPSTNAYSYLVGLRGWSDSSGGDSHELAFNNTGIYRRSGATTSWSNWSRLLDSSNYSSYLNSVYVGLTGNEGILGTKVFGSGTSYGSVTNKTSYTEKANINYNATLDALVFSFA